jgi:hypothetical protein
MDTHLNLFELYNDSTIIPLQKMRQQLMMTSIRAIGIAEGFVSAKSDEEYLQAWQLLVDNGQAWKLQGWFGRTATAMIEDGLIRSKEKNED